MEVGKNSDMFPWNRITSSDFQGRILYDSAVPYNFRFSGRPSFAAAWMDAAGHRHPPVPNDSRTDFRPTSGAAKSSNCAAKRNYTESVSKMGDFGKK